MNDKELLELASKAAGYSLYIWGTKGEENVVRVDEERHYRWNPLTDDGDALRLAVECALFESFDFCQTMSAAQSQPNPNEATRRAIVLAAAEIGRRM